MDKRIKVSPSVARTIKRIADTYARRMVNATPEQIERVRIQNELYERGVEICYECKRESLRDNSECEHCGGDKMPF
jgi:hypothetical protein